MSEHTHHHEPETSKYEQALKKYDLNLSDEAVKEAVAKIIAEKVPENDTTEVKRFLMGSVELTSLSTTDSEESILRFTERVNAFGGHLLPTCRRGHHLCLSLLRTNRQPIARSGGRGSSLRVGQFPLASPD